jgi:magnesium chelatase family protein
VRDYLARLSQPILDRIDLHVELEAVPVDDLVWSKPKQGEDAALIAQQIIGARNRQYARYKMLNNEASDALIKSHVTVTTSARTLLSHATQRLAMSARGYVRVLRVAVTIADLAGDTEVTEEHVAEAVTYRSLDRLSQLIGHSGAFRRASAVGG